MLTNSLDHPTSDLVESSIQALGGTPVRMNTDDLCNGKQRLTIELSHDGPSIWLVENGCTNDLMSMVSVWYRRPFVFDFRITDKIQRAAAESDLRHVLESTWLLLGRKHWVDRPEAIASARHKLLQQVVAASCGLTVPKTLVTNSSDKAKEFCSGPTVYKPIESYYYDYGEVWRETLTTLVDSELLSRIELVDRSPCQFQRFVRKVAECRVIWVGGRYFAIRLTGEGLEDAVDCRHRSVQGTLKSARVLLDTDTVAKLKATMSALGLVYGAIDLVESSAGDTVFLEVNPVGQWFSRDDQLNSEIATAIAATLLKGGEYDGDSGIGTC